MNPIGGRHIHGHADGRIAVDERSDDLQVGADCKVRIQRTSPAEDNGGIVGRRLARFRAELIGRRDFAVVGELQVEREIADLVEMAGIGDETVVDAAEIIDIVNRQVIVNLGRNQRRIGQRQLDIGVAHRKEFGPQGRLPRRIRHIEEFERVAAALRPHETAARQQAGPREREPPLAKPAKSIHRRPPPRLPPARPRSSRRFSAAVRHLLRHKPETATAPKAQAQPCRPPRAGRS